MDRLSESRRELLKKAVSKYHAALEGSPAEEFLLSRGLGLDTVRRFRFGYVNDPEPEHSTHAGKLAIPYLRKHPRTGWCCIDMRFRTLQPHGKPKYQSLPGSQPRLFNTIALTQPGMVVGVAEGEIDAVTATIAGLPTVGVPGATSWRPHWKELFRGYGRVIVFEDGDEAGRGFSSMMVKELPNATVVKFPEGEDVNSIFVNEGLDNLNTHWKGVY